MDTCMTSYENTEKTTVYVSFPQMNELCCIICKTDFIEVHESPLKLNFYWQTLKCRLLIHLVSDVIASPVVGTENVLFVIMHKPFFETGKLDTILKYFKLVYQGVRPVTTELYKNCLLYTIQSKIAPSWIKVNHYFLQGKEFYNSIEPIRAVKLDILIKEKEMHLLLQTQKVKIPYIKLEDYLPSNIISQFLADSKGYINLCCYKLPFVHVLPSTKKGKLLSISKEIPPQSRFKDYDQLRRYWKNMYGYSLPKNKDGILYYEIKFLIPRSDIFTYPSLCVAIGSLDVILNREKELTVTSFLSDMLKKLPKICGNQLQISKEILNATLSSNGSVESKELGTHFSVKCADKLKKNTNIASTSLNTQLVRIHKNQNDSQCFNSTQIPAMQSMITGCIGASTSKNLDVNSTEEESISRYFKVQKPHSVINKEVPRQERNQNRIPLKEKLLKFKFNENNNASVQETDENIDIEAMAKNNKLHEVQNKILSNWLKKHSIPHDSRGKKTELIKKILSHIRNTQVLKQYRV